MGRMASSCRSVTTNSLMTVKGDEIVPVNVTGAKKPAKKKAAAAEKEEKPVG